MQRANVIFLKHSRYVATEKRKKRQSSQAA